MSKCRNKVESQWGVDTEGERWGRAEPRGSGSQEMGVRLQVGRNMGVGLPNPDSVPQALTRPRSLEYEVVVEGRGKPTTKNGV